MKDLIRTLLRHAVQPADGALVITEPSRMNSQHLQALLDAARDRLRDAHAERDRAAVNLRESEERLQRALGVIDDSAAADRSSDQAQATARAASQLWTSRGCPECDAPDGDLLDAAAAAHNAAVNARLLADGARDAIPGLEAAIAEARLQLSQAEERVRAAAREVMLALAEAPFADLERAARECDRASLQVLGLARALAGNFGQPVRGGSEALLARVRESLPERPPDSATQLIREGQHLDSDSWLALARQLLEDPEAKL